MKVGVIGLGSMGMGAALNLAAKGHEVVGCELREASRAELSAAGGAAVASAADLPEDLEALVVFVVSAPQVDAVLFGPEGCIGKLRPGTIVLCCVTVAPDYARVLAKRLGEYDLLLLDAPVSGGAVGARAGTMTVMGSGPEAAFAKAAPVLEAISTKVWRLGDEAGKILGGPDLRHLPLTRAEYEKQLQAVGQDSWKGGYLPYNIIEGYQQLAKDFAYWRADSAGEKAARDPAHKAWLTQDQ